MLPKLSLLGNQVITRNDYTPLLGYTVVYFVTLLGFISYLIIDIFSHEESARPLMHKIQVSSFFFYNLLMGKIIAGDGSTDTLWLLMGTLVILFHLVGMNHVFHQWDAVYFNKRMRWVMALGIVIGVWSGHAHIMNEETVSLVTAFMSGAILINAIYYELPTKKQDNLYAFIGGIAAYIIIVSFLRTIQ